MKCKFCGGSGKDNWMVGTVFLPCPVCNGTGEITQTNEEWFCQLSTEEKAKWIAEEKMCRGYFIFPSMEEAIQDALEWLMEKHHD